MTGNIPFGKADLAAIVLASVLMIWQNHYNLTHLLVPESMPMLLLDLEAIEWVMVGKQMRRSSQRVRALPFTLSFSFCKKRGKATAACPDAKSSPTRKVSGG
jgi:hypothetical protein